jgi:predicted outer membrane lipoprotein
MDRSKSVAAAIAAIALLSGWTFLELLRTRASGDSLPFVETISFSLSTPAGLVLLTYLTGVFDFDRYYGTRSGPALFGDYVLTVLTAAAFGIPVTALILEVTTARQVLFVASSFVTFVAGFGLFYTRTREFFDWDAANAGDDT